MNQSVIMDNTVACFSFPEHACCTDGSQLIERDNILDTLEMMLDETELISVEGDEGIGKTTLLAQFAIRHNNNSISAFIKPANKWGYDPDVIRYDLGNQLSWILYKEEIKNPEDADESYFRNCILRLSRKARIENTKYYFIIDGLDDIPEDSNVIKEMIIDLLPVGIPQFRFLITGSIEKNYNGRFKSITPKSYPLTGFTFDESEKFLNDIEVDKGSLKEIYLTCKKMPGHLSTVKRILKSGMNVEDFINSMSNQLSGLFELEWKLVKENNVDDKALAIIAYSHKAHTIDEISFFIDKEREKVESMLNRLSFICIDYDKNSVVGYVTEAFRRFAKEKLYYMKNVINEIFINHLFKDPKSEVAITYLPGYLEQAGKYEDILKYLSPEHFLEVLSRTQSLSVLQEKAELGMKAAYKSNRDGDLIRFSVQKSILKDFEGAQIWRSEVEALIALDDFNKAIALSQSMILRQDRLHLLAIVCRKKREKGLPIETELIEQIENLYKEIDKQEIKDQAINIASDLIHVKPELAMNLIECSTDSRESGNELDWAFANLTLAAMNNGAKTQGVETVDSISSKIKDPNIRTLSESVKLLIANESARDLINSVSKFESTNNQLFIIRQWLQKNKRNLDSLEVVDYALKLAIKTSTYSPNASVLLDLSTPLPYIKDKDKVRGLIGNFDSQKGAIEQVGPTEDYIRLQLNLAHAHSKFDVESTTNRMIDIYLYIDALEDISLRTACLSRYVSNINKIDPNNVLEENEQLHSLAETQLVKDINTLLNTSADHFYSTRNIITALSKNKSSIALNIIENINTEDRRNLALYELVKTAAQEDVSKVDFIYLISVLNKINDKEIKLKTQMELFKRIDTEKDTSSIDLNSLMTIVREIEYIQDAASKCIAYCIAYNSLMQHPENNNVEITLKILEKLNETWEAIDIGWSKIDVGYNISSLLTKSTMEHARNYFQQTENIKDEIKLDAEEIANNYIACIRLVIRAYTGLLSKGLNTNEDFNRIHYLISQIPGNGVRAELWADIAARYFLNNKIDEFKKIVNEHVRPLIRQISIYDKQYSDKLIIEIAPILYYYHKLTTFETIDEICESKKDYALFNIAMFILHKTPPYDPYEAVAGQTYNISYEDITDLCEVLNRMHNDSAIYYIISCISDTIHYKRKRYTVQQIAQTADVLLSLITQKLPDTRNIKHEGYKIISEAQVARFNRSRDGIWEDLITRANAINNLADRSYILVVLATIMPSRELSRPRQLLIEAKSIIDSLPSKFDKIEHYEIFASNAWDIDSALCRECIITAMKTALTGNGEELFSAQRSLIDLTHRLDPDLATSLASLAENDEARKTMKLNIKNQVAVNDLKKNMSERVKPNIDHMAIKRLEYSRAAWKLLGSLNSGRVQTLAPENTREYIEVISKLPLSESYPIIAWVLENTNKRFANTEHASIFVRPLFEAVILGTQLSLSMSSRTEAMKRKINNTINITETNNSVIVKPGEREFAIQFVSEWVEREVKDYLKICDPYFGPEELEILKIIKTYVPNCKVDILTSIKYQEDKRLAKPWDDTYMNYWRRKISDQDPPFTEITLVGTQNQHDLPIHDRWWITKNSGLRVGTSFNSLGITKSSEISIIQHEEAALFEKEIDQYLKREKREHNGDRIIYKSFVL